jgi:integral membrane protein (TIGR01906 family)
MKTRNGLLVVALIYLIVYASLIISLNDETFFNREFSKLNVYSDFQNESLVNAKNQEIIGYIQGNVKNLDLQFFNQKEISHMQDVKNIFFRLKIISIIAILLVVIILGEMVWKNKLIKNIFRILVAIVSGEILLGAILAAIIFLNFEKAFIIFHQLLFSNNNWLLDPTADNLIRMYPQDFFVDITLEIIAKIGLITGILLFIAISLKIIDKMRSKKHLL